MPKRTTDAPATGPWRANDHDGRIALTPRGERAAMGAWCVLVVVAFALFCTLMTLVVPR